MSNRPFRAFVSYCHADRAFASMLQRRLESYRLPRRLAGDVAPLPGQPRGRIGPIFRDRADLSAAQDLSAAVRDAIAASSALVVVASPDAVQSIWVAREIALFRELHPHAPVLVALARGEPAEALPAALTESGPEPLAADFRREGDGKRLAFLKIVAGLAAVPLDALVQRDAQRQVRRVTAVTLAAAVLVVVMAGLLGMALAARAEADRRRNDAEGLVGYMRTTLRDQLKGVGSVKIMRAVNERALKYFDAQGDSRNLPEGSGLLRAEVLHALGEDDANRGQLSAGIRKFAEAFRATEAILKKHPGEAEAMFVHAQSEYWMGFAAWRTSDRPTATRHWKKYREWAGALARVEPGVRGLIEEGYAEGNLCDLDFRDSYDLQSARDHCSAAVHLMETAFTKSPSKSPTLIQDIANRHGWLARVQLAQGNYAAAMASRNMEAALLDKLLRADPRNAEYIMRRTWPDIGKAKILIEMGRADQAFLLLGHSWSWLEPELKPERSSQFWESGLRLLFFHARASKLSRYRENDILRKTIEKKTEEFLSLFPEEGKKIENLKRNIG